MTDHFPPKESHRQRLESLIEISQLLVGTIEPDALVRVILESAKKLFVAEAGSIALIDENAQQLAFVFSAGGAEVGSFRMKMGQGIVGWVTQSGEGVICRDVSSDQRFFSGIDNKTGYHTRSVLCAPLKQHGQVIGAIEVLNMAEPQSLTEDDLQLLTAFGGLASTAIDRARHFATTQNANTAFQELIQDRYRFIIGASDAMQSVVRLARTVAAANTTVLLLGESGTGKEILARSIHQWSPRAGHAFIAINCVALSPDLMESELFGHEKGAFTGAFARKAGKFELAEGGTIFLDEIGELTPKLQTKLLRVLQEREFQRVGGTKDIRADVRILAATNRDLSKALQSGEFREDLYYRLNVVSITMPPLRDRRDDIPGLIHHFLDLYSREVKRPRLGITPSAIDFLTSCPWKGNVRELQNAIERAVVLCPGHVIGESDFPAETRGAAQAGSGTASAPASVDETFSMAEAVPQFKRNLIRRALEKAQGNQAEAAGLLGIQRSNLSRLMKALNLR